MTFSFRIHREHGAFAASAICIGGVVPVWTRGRLSIATKPKSLNAAHASAYSEPLPINLPRVAQLVARLRPLRLLSRPFSSVVVIGNTLRRLASVLLLRQSQPPHLSLNPMVGFAHQLPRLVKNWCGLPITRRSVFSRCKPLQKSQRGLLGRFDVLSCPPVHVSEHEARNDGKITKAFGEFPNV